MVSCPTCAKNLEWYLLLTHCLDRHNMIALVYKQELWCFLKVFQHYIIIRYICKEVSMYYICMYKNDWICNAGKALVLCLYSSGKRVCSIYNYLHIYFNKVKKGQIFQNNKCCLILHTFYHFNEFFHFFRSWRNGPLNIPLDGPMDKPKPPKPSAKSKKEHIIRMNFMKKQLK